MTGSSNYRDEKVDQKRYDRVDQKRDNMVDLKRDEKLCPNSHPHVQIFIRMSK